MISALLTSFCGLIGLWGKKLMSLTFVLLSGAVETSVEVSN